MLIKKLVNECQELSLQKFWHIQSHLKERYHFVFFENIV